MWAIIKYIFGSGGGLGTKLCLILMTPWTVACQTPLSMGFPRQEYWSGLPFPSPGNLPNPEIKPGCPALQVNSLPEFAHQGSPSNICVCVCVCVCIHIWSWANCFPTLSCKSILCKTRMVIKIISKLVSLFPRFLKNDINL